MKGKIVLVTGANGGLGTSVVRGFLDAGATVVGTSRKMEQTEFAGTNFTGVAGDISSAEGARKLIEAVVARAGRIDVLAHTVGGFAGGMPLGTTDDGTFQRMMDLNLYATFFLLRAALPEIRKSGGRIIATGSKAAVDPGANVGAYSASKAAMVSLVRTIALENTDAGVTANVILPGTIDTPANRKDMPSADFSRWVQPASVASLMVWLAGEAGRDVNGAVIPVYGNS